MRKPEPTPRPLAAMARSLLALGVAAVSLVGLAGPAAAAGASYVALGDSYASGVGTRSYYSSSGSCQRSPYAYPVLAAARVSATLTFRACSGAKTGDVRTGQLDALSASTAYVTLQVGGNDAGFANVVTTCATPWWAADCGAAVDKAQAFIRDTLPARLDTLYGAVRAKATNAAVVVVGYPRLFNGTDCNAGTWFSPAEMTRLNATADQLNAALAARASAAGFTFVNPTQAFVGHAVCGAPEWVNGLSNPAGESYHPNRTGQVAYTDLVDGHLD